LLFLFGFLLGPLSAQDAFRDLIGDDLTGWEQYGGKAPYEVIDGKIVGTAVVNTPNSFLCTERPYGDFVVEFEFYDEAPLNSGVMFRAQWRQEKDLRRVYGYQMEIDPSARAYTGGIYDEARRGWIYPLHYHPPHERPTVKVAGTRQESKPLGRKFAPSSTVFPRPTSWITLMLRA
jgi:hypothetical protein